VLDGTAPEALSKKAGLLRGRPGQVLGGTLLAPADLATRLPAHTRHDPDPAADEPRFLERVEAAPEPGTLLPVDPGVVDEARVDRLTEHACGFLTRARGQRAVDVERVLQASPAVRDRLVRPGYDARGRTARPPRLVEVHYRGRWYRHLTTVRGPDRLSAADGVDLYGRRRRIGGAFLAVERRRGLSSRWTGAANGAALRCWATWLL
jgi:hypothetical protein